jgi:hypothetical protein
MYDQYSRNEFNKKYQYRKGECIENHHYSKSNLCNKYQGVRLNAASTTSTISLGQVKKNHSGSSTFGKYHQDSKNKM